MKIRVFTAFSGYDDIVDGEEWRDIKGFEGCYQVSNYGEVKSLPRQRRGREPQVLTPKRTEFGKAVRKQYENKELKMSRHTIQQLEPRKDGVTNTLTSVQKDNLVAEQMANTLDCGCQQGVVVSEGCALPHPQAHTKRMF